MQEFIEEMKKPIPEIAQKAITAYIVMVTEWLVLIETVSKLGNYQNNEELVSAIDSTHSRMGGAIVNFVRADYVTKEIAYNFIFGLSESHGYIVEINNHAKNLDEIVENGNLHEPDMADVLHHIIVQMSELVAS